MEPRDPELCVLVHSSGWRGCLQGVFLELPHQVPLWCLFDDQILPGLLPRTHPIMEPRSLRARKGPEANQEGRVLLPGARRGLRLGPCSTPAAEEPALLMGDRA